jgi:hypothetical protein
MNEIGVVVGLPEAVSIITTPPKLNKKIGEKY